MAVSNSDLVGKHKLLAANRGEICVRAFRAAEEIGIPTIAIYSYEDRLSGHRQKADEAYLIGTQGEFEPVEAYLQIQRIVDIAKERGATLVYPGYGFLSENPSFAKAVADAGLKFVGPSSIVIAQLGNKTAARLIASKCGVPTVPGTNRPIQNAQEAVDFISKHGYPVIVKACHGGGGRGMRVVREGDNVEQTILRAESEAKQAFGNGEVFLERFLDRPKHIEVQVLGDSTGNVIHLLERDCSLQRKHQKVVEIAPAPRLNEHTRACLLQDAVNLAKSVGYENAGTVEFLVKDKEYYFIEMNPRIQVEHTVTEEICGIDIVSAQIKIAAGHTLETLGLTQDSFTARGWAIQCRVTTEIPSMDFQPDTGRIEACRMATGLGVRLDTSNCFPGALITQHYDSLLVKCTSHALTFEDARKRMLRVLREFRIRGIHTNIAFLISILEHQKFTDGECWTTFIDDELDLKKEVGAQNRAQKLLRFFAEALVNGSSIIGQMGGPEPVGNIDLPVMLDEHGKTIDVTVPCQHGWRNILLRDGPSAFAKAVRAHPHTLLTDTTWRDAHQSLLATRVRTIDFENIAKHTSYAYSKAFSMECWGGATFDVAFRFLHEDPWKRLRKIRKLIPNICFQMLLRSVNGVAYSALPDNAVFHFVRQAKANGVDIFRVFDGLNNIENLEIGIKAVLYAGGVAQGAILYTGDMFRPGTKYNLSYYLHLANKLVHAGAHFIAVKSMAGVLKPGAAFVLVRAIRTQHPEIPIHMHTHDAAGIGVATMLACAEAGADIVDGATDSISGTTSQPAMSAIIAGLESKTYASELPLKDVQAIDKYWAQVRLLYAGFDAKLTSPDPDVYTHEIPGGQLSNLLFQARQLGLGDKWEQTKQAFVEANLLLGDIVKATPTSKAVGDLAQFMVNSNLSFDDVVSQAESLDFPSSVLDYFQGLMGQPFDGFPEPLRTQVLRNHRTKMKGRPGLHLKPINFQDIYEKLRAKHGPNVDECDIASHIMYPDVYAEYRATVEKYGDLSIIPTRYFLAPIPLGEEIEIDIETGKTLHIKALAQSAINADGTSRDVFFELNGEIRYVNVIDLAAVPKSARRKADLTRETEIGSPLAGTITQVCVEEGSRVTKSQVIMVLSAMKMELNVSAFNDCEVHVLHVAAGDKVDKGDLLVEFT